MRDRHHLVDEAGGRRRLAGDADGPPALGRGAGDGDVTAKAHQRAASEGVGDACRRPVRRQRLGRGAQVEPDTAWDAHGAGAGIQLHVQVPSHRSEGARRRRWPRAHVVEVGVVAERSDGIADRRVDGPAGALGGIERHLERLEEERAHPDGASGTGVHHLQLGVVAEAAAGLIDGLDLGRQQALGRVGGAGVLHDHRRGGPDGPERAGRQRGRAHLRGRHAEDPPDVTAGVVVVVVGVDTVPALPPDVELPPTAVEPDPDDTVAVVPALAPPLFDPA